MLLPGLKAYFLNQPWSRLRWLSASVNAGKGKENGTTLTHTETTVNAGDTLTIVSGRDTNLTGAQVSGESVLADIGRHLTITSEQDIDHYDSSQKNISAGGSFSFGTMTGSGGISYSRDKMDSGFDVTVGGHTQLDGGVMASTSTGDKKPPRHRHARLAGYS